MTSGVVDVAAPRDESAPLPARPRRRLRRRLFLLAAVAGPGLIAANAGNDAAGIATYASAGSQYRYDTLFFMLLVTVALIMVQEMAVRLGAHTGKGLAALIREQFSLRLAGLALACLVLANTGLVISEFAGIGAAFQLLGIPREIAIPPAAALLWALVVFGSYKRAQRVFLMRVAGVPGLPDRDGARASALGPRRLAPRDAAPARVERVPPARRRADRYDGQPVHAVLRGGRRRRPADDGSKRPSMRLLRVDAIVGAVFACVISITIIVATGTAIGGTGPLDSAKQAALALKPAAAGSVADRCCSRSV